MRTSTYKDALWIKPTRKKRSEQCGVIKGKMVRRKKGKANRCILRSILLPEDFP